MLPENLLPSVLIPLVFAGVTQLVKQFNPEGFQKATKYITAFLAGFGALFNLVFFMAMNAPLVTNNIWHAVLIYTSAIIQGAILGLAATGVYEVSKPVSFIKSAEEILTAKG